MSLVPASILQGDGYSMVEDAALEGRNTFRVPARAELLIDVRRPALKLPGWGRIGVPME